MPTRAATSCVDGGYGTGAVPGGSVTLKQSHTSCPAVLPAHRQLSAIQPVAPLGRWRGLSRVLARLRAGQVASTLNHPDGPSGSASLARLKWLNWWSTTVTSRWSPTDSFPTYSPLCGELPCRVVILKQSKRASFTLRVPLLSHDDEPRNNSLGRGFEPHPPYKHPMTCGNGKLDRDFHPAHHSDRGGSRILRKCGRLPIPRETAQARPLG